MTRWKLTPPGVGVHSNPFSVVNRPGSLWLAAISTIRRQIVRPASSTSFSSPTGSRVGSGRTIPEMTTSTMACTSPARPSWPGTRVARYRSTIARAAGSSGL